MARRRRWTVVFVPHGSEPSKVVEVSYGLIKPLVDGLGAADNGAFYVSNDMFLFAHRPLDFEAQPSYSIRVRATDGEL